MSFTTLLSLSNCTIYYCLFLIFVCIINHHVVLSSFSYALRFTYPYARTLQHTVLGSLQLNTIYHL